MAADIKGLIRFFTCSLTLSLKNSQSGDIISPVSDTSHSVSTHSCSGCQEVSAHLETGAVICIDHLLKVMRGCYTEPSVSEQLQPAGVKVLLTNLNHKVTQSEIFLLFYLHNINKTSVKSYKNLRN